MIRKLPFILPALLLLFGTPLQAQEVLIALHSTDYQQPDVTELVDLETAKVRPYNQSDFAKFVKVSESVSTSTGIAMSPLLGMGALGAWQYFRADAVERALLPWYTHPWVWGISLGLFLLLKSKDTLGAWIPEVVKKPITIIDDLQEKASAVIVALAVIPAAVLSSYQDMNPQPSASLGSGDPFLAMLPLAAPLVLVIVCVVVFTVVWLSFNVFSSIKVFSPSSLINSTVSVIKGVLIGIYAFFMAMNPWVALVAALIVFTVCLFLFGWAFRWHVFGFYFVKDFLTSSFQKALGAGEPLCGFSTPLFSGVKPRTYGEIKRQGDELVFSWKPWLIGPRRRARIQLSEVESGVRKGIFVPSVTVKIPSLERHRSLVDLRMRFHTHEDSIRERLGLDVSSPNFVLSGLRACWQWIRDQVRRSGNALGGVLEPAP